MEPRRVLVQAGSLRDFAYAQRLVGGAQYVQYVGAASAEREILFRSEGLICVHVATLFR